MSVSQRTNVSLRPSSVSGSLKPSNIKASAQTHDDGELQLRHDGDWSGQSSSHIQMQHCTPQSCRQSTVEIEMRSLKGNIMLNGFDTAAFFPNRCLQFGSQPLSHSLGREDRQWQQRSVTVNHFRRNFTDSSALVHMQTRW